MLSATLALRGVACRSLGADLPADALIAAIRRTAPVAILLWSQLPDTADPDLLEFLPGTRPGYRTFVAGPGWADIALAPRIARLSSLEEATNVMSAVAAAQAPLSDAARSRLRADALRAVTPVMQPYRPWVVRLVALA